MLGQDGDAEAVPPVGDGDAVPLGEAVPPGDAVGEAVGDDVGDAVGVGDGPPEEVHPASSAATVSTGSNAHRAGVVPISSSVPRGAPSSVSPLV